MRILYLSLSYVPSRRASSVQVMKMCAALARQGHEVVLVVKTGPAAEAAKAADDFAFYGVEPSFRIEKLPRPARKGGGVVYAAAMAGRLAALRRWADLVYCRDPVGGAAASLLRMPVVFEAHGLPGDRLQRAMWRRMTGSRGFVAMVAISDALRRDVRAEGLLPEGIDCIVAHDAADVPVRAPSAGRATGRPHIGYVGNLYKGRGIELRLDVARRMPEADFDVVGGSDGDIARWKAASPPANVHFHGFFPHARLHELYDRFDLVLMPHSREGVVGASGASDISRWTSPMKMFEYMGSGVPMVASDLPVLQEVLRHGENALIARADDPDDWIEKIRALVADPPLRTRLAADAQPELNRHHTGEARARHVIDHLPGHGARESGAQEAISA